MNKSRYWEPWIPRLGDRVRILPTPECPVEHPPLSYGLLARVVDVSRPIDDEDEDDEDDLLTEDDLFDGETWEEMRQSVRNFRGHWYSAHYDIPVRDPGSSHPIQEGLYAAVELERLP